jgi:hypothetical protein
LCVIYSTAIRVDFVHYRDHIKTIKSEKVFIQCDKSLFTTGKKVTELTEWAMLRQSDIR